MNERCLAIKANYYLYAAPVNKLIIKYLKYKKMKIYLLSQDVVNDYALKLCF